MNDLVYMKNDEAVCDSLQVAEKFGKRHDKLISEIERMYSDLIGEGCAQNGGDPMFIKKQLRPPTKQTKISNVSNEQRWLLVVSYGIYWEESP